MPHHYFKFAAYSDTDHSTFLSFSVAQNNVAEDNNFLACLLGFLVKPNALGCHVAMTEPSLATSSIFLVMLLSLLSVLV